MQKQKSTLGHSNRRPTAAVVEYRRPLFAVARVWVTEGAQPVETGTAWGRVRVIRGGVTQRHRDLLDAIRAVAKYRVTDQAGQEHLIFDVAEVRALDIKGDWRDIRNDLLDMLSTVIQIDGTTPGSWGAAFPLATFVGDASSQAAREPHQFPARLKRLVLSAGFSKLLDEHATVTLSRDVLAKVLTLPHAVCRAVARWCLSHSSDQHHDLSRVLAAIGVIAPEKPISGRASSRQTRRYVQQLRASAAALAELGIEICGDRIHYRRRDGVFITAPAPAREVDAKPAVNHPAVDAKSAVVD